MNINEIVATWTQCSACGALCPDLQRHRCKFTTLAADPAGRALPRPPTPADVPVRWCRQQQEHPAHLWRHDGNLIRELDGHVLACPGVEPDHGLERWTEARP